MIQNNGMIKNLSAQFWHRLYHIRMLEGRDVQPDNDNHGLWARRVNRLGLSTYDDHFRSGLIPTGYSWITDGTFNGTPGTLTYSYLGTYMHVSTSTTPNFLADAITVYSGETITARIRANSGAEFGLRIDDGSDNNYVEAVLDPSVGMSTLDHRERAGGGAVTDIPGPTARIGEFWTVSMLFSAGSGIVYTYLSSEDHIKCLVGSFATGALGWVPARVGLVLRGNSNTPAACDWIHSTFT